MKQPLTKKQTSMLIFPVIMVISMLILFPLLTNTFGKTVGYISAYAIYLLFGLTGIVLFGSETIPNSSPNMCGKWYDMLAFFPAIPVFFVAFVPIAGNVSTPVILIAAAYAAINGSIEELFWRGCYNKQFSSHVTFAYIYPTILFSLWHFALYFANGIHYSGGWAALVVGAAFMGAIWGFVVYKTKSIKTVIFAHILVNFFAFSQLIYQNWFI